MAETTDENPLYKNIDPEMIKMVNEELHLKQNQVTWTDVAGLENVKTALNELVILPHKRPELFTGLRAPVRGLLLFGAPGNGKTLIGKALCSEAGLTFFAMSASAVISKWLGDGAKLIRALFAVARAKQPSLVFIDDLESLFPNQAPASAGEDTDEKFRRAKTELLVALDSLDEETKITVIGVTNKPQNLDEAIRRRLTKRIYVPMPDTNTRKQFITATLKKADVLHGIRPPDLTDLAALTEGFARHDLHILCMEAAMEPIRQAATLERRSGPGVRQIVLSDFQEVLKRVRPSISQAEIQQYEDWNEQFGSFSS